MKTRTLLFVSILFMATASPAAQTITIKGSDTMVILNQRWAETYMAKNKQVTIQVTGGGTGTGISSLLNGSTDICAASRPMKDKENQALQGRYGAKATQISVARDGVAVYLNAQNPVGELSLEQLRNIYKGKITNWRDVGGDNAKIILYSRENNSGTYLFFKDHVLGGKDFSPMAQSLPGTAAVVNGIARDKRGIGYGGSAYAKGIKFCAIKESDSHPAYSPTEENVISGKYPASRDLYFYMRAEPQGETKKFIDWILGPEGQKIVTTVGYFPVKK